MLALYEDNPGWIPDIMYDPCALPEMKTEPEVNPEHIECDPPSPPSTISLPRKENINNWVSIQL